MIGIGPKNVSQPLLIFSWYHNFTQQTKKMLPRGGKYPIALPWKFAPNPQERLCPQISYIFIIAGLEPKLIVFKSSTQ